MRPWVHPHRMPLWQMPASRLECDGEFDPGAGLELTATPQVGAGARTEPFKNILYRYPLSSAMTDGFVKEPAVATRENFDVNNYDAAGTERTRREP